MTTPKLPFDRCRCHAAGCEKSGQCLRFTERFDVISATPWTERRCAPGRESEHFILNRQEETP